MSEAHAEIMQPDEAFALANAMALRAGQLDALVEQIQAEVKGEDYKAPTPEEIQGAHLGRTVLYLAKVESPDSPITWIEMLDAANTDGGYDRMAQEGNSVVGELEIKAEQARNVQVAFAAEVQTRSGLDDERLTQDFAKTLATAREVAVEHGTNVASVYETDELYYEVIRRAFTLAGSVREAIEVLDTMSNDTVSTVLMQQLENLMPKELLDDLEPGEIAEIAEEMRADPNLQAQMASYLEPGREAIRQAYTYLLTKVYGAEAVNALPSDVKVSILPRRRLTSIFETLD